MKTLQQVLLFSSEMINNMHLLATYKNDNKKYDYAN